MLGPQQRRRQTEKALAAAIIEFREHLPQDGNALVLLSHEPVKAVRPYRLVIAKYPLVRDKGVALNLFTVGVFRAGEFRTLTAGIKAVLIRAAGFHGAGRVLAPEAIAAAAGAERAAIGVEAWAQAAVDTAATDGGVGFHIALTHGSIPSRIYACLGKHRPPGF